MGKHIVKDNKVLLARLEELVKQMGYGLSYADVPGSGGLAKYKGKKRFIINRFLSYEEKIDILCSNLRHMDLQDVYLLPVVRRAIFGDEQGKNE